MNIPRDLRGHTALDTKLAAYLHQTGSALSATEVTALAVDAWLRAAATTVPEAHLHDLRELRGYQWKCLFIPHGSELRMITSDDIYYARVIGDHITYEGRQFSPRGLTLALAGPGINAWRKLYIRMPGEKTWRQAAALRSAIQAAEHSPPPSPADTMDAVAASMADALQTVLALASHVKADSLKMVERRNDKRRRASDAMEDACRFD